MDDKEKIDNTTNTEETPIDVVSVAMDEEDKEETKELTEELRPLAENKKPVETEDSVDVKDFVTKDEFYGKENNTVKIVSIIIVCVICIVIGYFVLKYANIQIGSLKHDDNSSTTTSETTTESTKEDKVSEEKNVAEYNDKYGALYFYSDNGVVISSDKLLNDVGTKKYLGMYNCESNNCSLAKTSFYSLADNTVLVSDNDKSLIYDYSTNKIKSNSYANWYVINVGSRKYLLAIDTTTNIYGSNGNNITGSAYTKIGLVVGDELKEYYDSYIIAQANNKWGIINITNNKAIVECKYDEMYMESKEVFIAKEDSLWYVINDKGEKLNTTGYKEIVKATNTYIMVINNNSFDIVDYTGTSLINISIDAPSEYKRYGDTITFKDEGDNIMLITIGTNAYRFNTNTYAISKYTA